MTRSERWTIGFTLAALLLGIALLRAMAVHRPRPRMSVNLDGYREGRRIARSWQSRKEISPDG